MPSALRAASAEQGNTAERLDLIDAVIYGDVFDCAVTHDELWRYARVAIGRDALWRRLRDDAILRRVIVERDGLYCLTGRTPLLSARPKRLERARRLQRRARGIARFLRHLPFVNGLVLTGSTSADDAREQADIDLLVIVAEDRIASAFLLLGSTSRLLKRRLFCPNWYVCEAALSFGRKNVYFARELAQSQSLVGRADVLVAANPWIAEVFPNLAAAAVSDRKVMRSTRLHRWLDTPFRGPLGDRVERWARGVATARMRAHYAGLGQQIPADVAAKFNAGMGLSFHGYRYEQRTMAAYSARRVEVMNRLEHIERETIVPALRISR